MGTCRLIERFAALRGPGQGRLEEPPSMTAPAMGRVNAQGVEPPGPVADDGAVLLGDQRFLGIDRDPADLDLDLGMRPAGHPVDLVRGLHHHPNRGLVAWPEVANVRAPVAFTLSASPPCVVRDR